MIVAVAVQEDVPIVGLSILSGAHLALTAKSSKALQGGRRRRHRPRRRRHDPRRDVPRLEAVGVAAVFPTGTPLDSMVSEIKTVISNGPWSH